MSDSKNRIQGTWPKDDLRRAFVMGAKWWEYHTTQFTMWNSDIKLAEDEAEKEYPDGKVN
jgi:hypothetical protein